jgi:hypothetical protein
MDIYEQARRLSHVLAGIDARITIGTNDREVYELLNQYGDEFDVDLDLVDMSHLHLLFRWVIPLRNHTGIAVVTSSSGSNEWRIHEGLEIPAEIAAEIKRCAKRKRKSV